MLVDTTPDLRAQALRHDVRRVDAVLYTHSHADHLMGLDEIRRFNVLTGRAMPIYGDARTLASVRQTFSYVFESNAPKGGGVPDLRLWPIGGRFSLGRQEIVPVPIFHGARPILGLRLGQFAYLTDCSRIPDESMALLDGLDVLVLDALRVRPHPTHFSLDEAVAAARAIGASRTYFTHMCHDLQHAPTCERLPGRISLAYDGLVVEC